MSSPETVRAVVLFGPDRMEVAELAQSAPGPGEVVVRMGAAGVCHSDLNVYERGGSGMLLPAVLGHEGAGVVESVGDEVDLVAVGDHVVTTVVPECGRCAACRRGQPTLCPDGLPGKTAVLFDGTTRLRLGDTPVGQMAGLGCWSTRAVVGQAALVRIDPDVPFAPASLLGCGVVTGFGAARNTGGVGAGDSVAVIGCGGVGLAGLQGARTAGATTIVAVDVVAEKLDLARRLGATHVVDALEVEDAAAVVRQVTGGEGVDVALDFVGTSATAAQAIASTRPGGTIVCTGLAQARWDLDVAEIVRKGRTLRGNYMGMSEFRRDVPLLVDLYRSGQLLLDEMVSQTIGLDDVPEAFAAMREGRVARSVIVPDAALAA